MRKGWSGKRMVRLSVRTAVAEEARALCRYRPLDIQKKIDDME